LAFTLITQSVTNSYFCGTVYPFTFPTGLILHHDD